MVAIDLSESSLRPEALKASVPSFVVLVASLEIEELVVSDGDFGGIALRSEVDRNKGVCRGSLPSPGIDKLAGWIDQMVGAYDIVDVTAFVSDRDAILVAYTKVNGGLGGVVIGGGKPLTELVGVCPGFEDTFTGRLGRCGKLRATTEMRRRLATCFVLLFFGFLGIGLFEESAEIVELVLPEDAIEGEPVGGLLHWSYGETAHADAAGFFLLDEAGLFENVEVLEDGGHGDVVRAG